MSEDDSKATAIDAIAARAARGARQSSDRWSSIDALYEALKQPANDRLVSEGVIDRGGMGAVELVVDKALQRRLALKSLHPEYLKQYEMVRLFVREARITAQLDHPNIVPVHNIGSNNNVPYFTMKRVQGRTLTEVIKKLPPGKLPRDTLCEILDVIVKVCDALAFAHSRGVLHCDLKPQNIMVGDYGQVYLMDWGIARIGDAFPSGVLDGLGELGDSKVIGTAAYMSPEQASGGTIDQRSDVFSMGAVLYQVLTRKAPYDADDYEGTLALASRGEVTPPSDLLGRGTIPVLLERIVLKAMAPVPDRRYSSVEALEADIVRFLRGGESFPKVNYPAGAYIVREGEIGDAAYIIVSGSCDVSQLIDGQRHLIRALGRGEVFGETAILTSAPRTADVIAIEDTTVQVVSRDVLESELTDMKPWLASLIRTLAERFRTFAGDRRITTALNVIPPRRRK